MKFQLENIMPNPFRCLSRYPMQEHKIQALMKSFKQTGYWGNIVARKRGKNAEIAYGHHRLEALVRIKAKEADLIIKPLSDEKMVQIMANENMQEWGSYFWVVLETVRSAREFLSLSEPNPKNLEVAKLLGWTDIKEQDGKKYTVCDKKVRTAFEALELIEQGALEESAINPTLFTQAVVLVSGAKEKLRLAKSEAVAIKDGEKKRIKLNEGAAWAREATKAASRAMQEGKASTREAKALMRGIVQKKKGPPPDIDIVANRVASKVSKFLTIQDSMMEEMKELIRFKKYISELYRENLVSVLDRLADRATTLAGRFEGKELIKKGKGHG